MKNYTDVKIAKSDLRKLTEMYCFCKRKQTKLKATLGNDEPLDVRCEAFVYRLGLGEMQRRITRLKNIIKQLDREIARKNLEKIRTTNHGTGR